MKNSIVLTTINKLNTNIKKLIFLSQQNDLELIVIGDKKTPKNFNLKYGNYYNIKDQKKLRFNFSKICPLNSYSRKNIGYLVSIQNGNETIIETDDDNYPKNNFLKFLDLKHEVNEIKEIGWTNVYKKFTKKNLNIWPRGLPLNKIENSPTFKNKKVRKNFYLKQGVCEGNPDVDAIYRIINKNINIKFKNEYKFSLGKAFSPINSQNTIWSKILFPLMYLPVTCTMRATDIWRGLIALNIISNDNLSVLFYGTTMKQNRNFHVLENDLKDELPLFESVENAFEILKNLKLKKGPQNYLVNLHKSYDYLIKNDIFDKKEMFYLNSWIRDINKLIT
tara:strand:- start:450 stop:1454 length:1005 start_codon:yes stop_codon:yes gene_type:complete